MKSLKKCLFIPGVGAVPEDCIGIKNLFRKHNLNLEILDSRKILDFKKTEIKNLSNLINFNGKVGCFDFLIGSSLGGAVAIELVLLNEIKTKNLILINPHLRQIDNYFLKVLVRLKDSGKMIDGKNFSAVRLGKFIWKYLPRLKIIRRELNFVKGLNFFAKYFRLKTKTFFLLGERDETCPLDNYNLIKSRFLNKELIILPGIGHDWDSGLELLEEKFKKIGLFK